MRAPSLHNFMNGRSALALLLVTTWAVAGAVSMATGDDASFPDPAWVHRPYGDGSGGAQYDCNSARGAFTLLALDEDGLSAHNPNPEERPEIPRSGFTAVMPYPAKYKLACRLKTAMLHARISESRGFNGFCGGYRATNVYSLAVNRKELLNPNGIAFNYPCTGDTLVAALRIRVRGGDVELTTCSIPWEVVGGGWVESKPDCVTKAVH